MSSVCNYTPVSKSCFIDLFNMLDVGILVVDDHNVLFFNDYLHMLTEFSREDLDNINLRDLVKEPNWEKYLKQNESRPNRDHNGVDKFSFELYMKSGLLVQTMASIKSIEWGGSRAYLITIHSISSNFLHCHSDELMEMYVETLLKSRDCCVLEVDRSGRIVSTNSAFCYRLGKDQQEVVGTFFWSYATDKNELTTLEDCYEGIINDPKKIKPVYSCFNSLTEDSLHFFVSFKPIIKKSGEVAGAIVVLLDVSPKANAKAKIGQPS